MRIDGIHIDGFGEYSDTSLPRLARPVTVFHGPNEAGKSTLLAFLRMVLFGFPPRKAAEHYPPAGTRGHGGRIELSSDDGEHFVLTRRLGPHGGPLTLARADGTPIPEARLAALLGHASASTFQAVFAFDLDGLQQIDARDDSGISSRIYSAGAGAARLPRARKQLRERAEALYAPRGSKQPVARVLGELQVVERELREAQSQAREYGAAAARGGELERGGAALRGQCAELRARVDELRRRQAAWETWQALLAVETRLADIPRRDGFPDNPLARLDDLEERLREADAQVAGVDADLARAREQAEQPVEWEELLQAETAVEALRRNRGGFDASVRDLPKRQVELGASETDLADALRALGPTWDAARLAAFDNSLPRQDEVEQQRVRIEETSAELRDRTRDAEQAGQALEDAQQRLRDRQGQLDQRAAGGASDAPAAGWKRAATGALAVSGALAVAAGFVFDSGAVLFVLGAALLVLAAIPYVLAAARYRSGGGQELRRLAEDARRRAEEAAADVERARARREAARQRQAQQQAAAEAAAAEWQAWLRGRELPEALTPNTVRELFSRVDTARVLARTAGEKRQRVAAIQKDIDTYCEAVRALAGGGDEPAEAADRRADTIVQRFDQAREAARARDEARRAAEALADRRKQAADRRAEIADRIGKLLALADTADPEEFRRRARQHIERQGLEQERNEHVSALRATWAHKQELETLRGVLAATTSEEIDAALQTAGAALSELEQQIAEQGEERGRLQARMQQLSSSDDASRLRGRRAELEAELRSLAADWSTLAVARWLLERARRQHEEQRQPDVVRRAETFFRGLTGGRYRKLHVTAGEQEIIVVDGTERRKTPGQLSRGTREQLYLALRFGLVQSLGEETERLPVVVDEVLVNFDLERARRAADAFVELSRTNQVLVLTCHQWIVDLFREAAPDAAVIDLAAARAGA